MYLAMKGLVTVGGSERPMVWIRATPSSASVAHLAEVGAVVVDADVLEHADRDDAVEAALDLAVVLELEVAPSG